MLKKFTSFLFLLAAFAILLGHSVIPHHHHDTTKELAEYHHTNHQHNGEHGIGDLSHLFSHFIHSGDGLSFTSNQNISNVFSKQFSLIAVLSEIVYSYQPAISPLLHSPPFEPPICASPHSLASGLRAPPSFVA